MKVVGITPGFDFEKEKYVLNAEYVEAIKDAGAIPLILPYQDTDFAIKRLVDIIDGFVFAGGGDISPYFYREEPISIRGLVPERDEFELKLFKEAFARKKPILGICRGMQLINVALGGTLLQNIKGIQHWQNANTSVLSHSIKVLKGTKLYEILGKENLMVNSFHHQAVGKLGEGLIASAKAPDEVIEAIEHKDKSRFLLGVQFHIETIYKKYPIFKKIFESFVQALES